jgi:hypothetical protein
MKSGNQKMIIEGQIMQWPKKKENEPCPTVPTLYEQE